MATMQPDQPFLADVKEIRRRARQHMEKGAVTEGYKGDLETTLRVLNEALATEIVCVLRYKRHQYMAHGLNATSVAEEFALAVLGDARRTGRLCVIAESWSAAPDQGVPTASKSIAKTWYPPPGNTSTAAPVLGPFAGKIVTVGLVTS